MSEAIFFYSFATVTVVMMLFMIFQTNPVSSALCLIFSFFGLAGLYVLLSAPFVAVLQILVYAGAIMVLFIFVIMLLKLRQEDLISDSVSPLKIAVSLAVIAAGGYGAYRLFAAPYQAFGPTPPGFGEAKPVGELIFTQYLLPFEVASVLLLAAIVGVILLGQKGSESR